MTFKWKIVRPFHTRGDNIELTLAGVEVEFETGSIGEAHGIFSDESTKLAEIFGGAIISQGAVLADKIESGTTTEATAETGEQTGTKERKPRKPKGGADPTTASAPAPIDIPAAAAPPTAPAPVNMTSVDGGIPPGLARDPATNTAPALAPPPPPPPAPQAPPSGVLAGKIIANLDQRAANAADGGQGLADWLATSGLTIKGATYAEALDVIRFKSDETLGPIAASLGVTA